MSDLYGVVRGTGHSTYGLVDRSVTSSGLTGGRARLRLVDGGRRLLMLSLVRTEGGASGRRSSVHVCVVGGGWFV